MAIERTLSIIKPDAVAKDIIGKIYSRLEENGLRIVAARMLHMTREQAEVFYAVHREKPFFKKLVDFMISGPIIVQVLEGDDAINKNRELMGATNPRLAVSGTIRHDFASDNENSEVHENAIHGSDCRENARTEIDFFFKREEICPRTR